jgi:hypothetical protein
MGRIAIGILIGLIARHAAKVASSAATAQPTVTARCKAAYRAFLSPDEWEDSDDHDPAPPAPTPSPEPNHGRTMRD